MATKLKDKVLYQFTEQDGVDAINYMTRFGGPEVSELTDAQRKSLTDVIREAVLDATNEWLDN